MWLLSWTSVFVRAGRRRGGLLAVLLFGVSACSGGGDDGDGGSEGSDGGQALGISGLVELPIDDAAGYDPEGAMVASREGHILVVYEVELVDGQYEFVYQMYQEHADRLLEDNGSGTLDVSLCREPDPETDRQEVEGLFDDSADSSEGQDEVSDASLDEPDGESLDDADEALHTYYFRADHGAEPRRLRTELTPEQAAGQGKDSLCVIVALFPRPEPPDPGQERVSSFSGERAALPDRP